jgi:hypothetical protein
MLLETTESLDGLSLSRNSDTWSLFQSSSTQPQIPQSLLHAHGGMDVQHILSNYGSNPAAEQQNLFLVGITTSAVFVRGS